MGETMQQEEATMQIQPRQDGGKSIVITKRNGETQRIELSTAGDVITSTVQGQTTATVAPAAPALPPARRKALPDGIVPMMAIIFGSVTVMSLFTPIIKAWARRFERRAEFTQQALVEQRLAAIEQAIETVAVEVERISEGQRFTTKLLADKAQPEMERVRCGRQTQHDRPRRRRAGPTPRSRRQRLASRSCSRRTTAGR